MDKLTFQSKEYTSHEAKLIDEMVFFYVPQTVLEADETFLTVYAEGMFFFEQQFNRGERIFI